MTPAEPLLRVVAGQPTSEEVAALTAALALVRGRAAAEAAGGPAARAGWAGRAGLLRAPLARGPGGWRRSALPR